MTYCVALAVDNGLIFASDSRTNAGIDRVSSYPKAHRFCWEGNRTIVILSAGSLATTQVVLKQIDADLQNHPNEQVPENLLSQNRMIDVADYIGRMSAAAQQRQGDTAQGVDLQASFIVGGQIQGEKPEMYLVYPEGNYITYSPNQPFLQLGETKYGKPILDRLAHSKLGLGDAARVALVSMDSTIRSNASVGAPIDLITYQSDSFVLDQELNMNDDDPYFADLRGAWAVGLTEAFHRLPKFSWEQQLSLALNKAEVTNFPPQQNNSQSQAGGQ